MEFIIGAVVGGAVVWFFKDWLKGLFAKLPDVE